MIHSHKVVWIFQTLSISQQSLNTLKEHHVSVR